MFDDQGQEVAVARIGTEVLRPRPGWAEQDMDAVWNGVVFTVRSVLSQLGPAQDPVWLVSFTAQGDGCWLVDGDGPSHRPRDPVVGRARRRPAHPAGRPTASWSRRSAGTARSPAAACRTRCSTGSPSTTRTAWSAPGRH
ncbi:hypothetical protein LT493_12250 [Streptomyces tricolor]|nr:hypothetical protein [Streptomyces tricolor]